MCQLGILTVIAKLGSTELLGRYSIAFAITTPIVTFCMLNLRAIQITDVEDRAPFAAYLGLRLVSVCVAMIAIACVAFAGFEPRTAAALSALGLAKSIEAVSEVIFGYLQRHEQMKQVAISQAVKGVLSLGSMAVLVHTTKSIAWCCLGLSAAWALTLVAIDFPALRRVSATRSFRPIVTLSQLRPILVRALPLAVVVAMLPLITGIPRILLERSDGLELTGVYAAILTLTLPGSLLVNAFGLTSSPRIARAWVERDFSRFRAHVIRLIVAAAGIGIIGFAVVVVAGAQILRIAFSSQIAGRAEDLWIVMLAGLLWHVSSVVGYVATAAQRAHTLPLATAASLGVTLGAGLWLVPRMGLSGALWTALIAPAVLLPAYVTLAVKTKSR